MKDIQYYTAIFYRTKEMGNVEKGGGRAGILLSLWVGILLYTAAGWLKHVRRNSQKSKQVNFVGCTILFCWPEKWRNQKEVWREKRHRSCGKYIRQTRKRENTLSVCSLKEKKKRHGLICRHTICRGRNPQKYIQNVTTYLLGYCHEPAKKAYKKKKKNSTTFLERLSKLAL